MMSFSNLADVVLDRYTGVVKRKKVYESESPISENSLSSDKFCTQEDKRDLEDLLFWSGKKPRHRCKLRRKLNKTYHKNGFLVHELIKTVVKEFVEQCKPVDKEEEDEEEDSPMTLLFYCNCGWLLFNPVTLLCGHTMCKSCADENMCCNVSECSTVIESPYPISTFLVDLISSWFKQGYRASEFKKEAKELILKKEYSAALTLVSKALVLAPEDYTSLNMRSEIYSNLNKHKDAMRDAELSCQINSSNGKSQFRKGLCYSNLGDLNNAIDAFQLCLELEPDNVMLRNEVVDSLDKALSPPDPPDEINIQERIESLESSDPELDNKIPAKKLKSDPAEQPSYSINSKKSPSVTKQTSVALGEKPKCSKSSPSNCPVSTCISSTHDDDNEDDILSLLDNEVPETEKCHGVPINLIKEDDFECKLCYDLFYKPVTTPCGHVFCRNCIMRTLDHNPNCPICRVSLKDYLANQSKPLTQLIVTILEIYLKKQYQERERVYMERLEKLSRVGIDETVEVPIFICSIAFPYVTCPLHIFEPKYRLMIRDSIESGSRKFGMCIPKSAEAADGEFSDIGTICEITSYKTLPDGRFIIHTVAGQRFTILDKRLVDSLYYANVTYFCDEPEDLSLQRFNLTTRQIYDRLEIYINTLKKPEQDCIFNALGRLPSYSDHNERFTHGIPWVWWGLAALPLNLTAKVVLLRSKCVSERMLSLQRFLRFLEKLNPADSNT